LYSPLLEGQSNFGIIMENFWWQETISLMLTMTLIMDFTIRLIGTLNPMMDLATRSV